jgi:hypothetical protein
MSNVRLHNMPHHLRRRLALSTALLAALPGQAQTEMPLALPSNIQAGQCRPLNVGAAEMDKQWELHRKYAHTMQANAALVEEERKSLAARAMVPEYVECFAGREVFAALCFTKARTKSLDIRSLKLMHS